MLIENKDLTNDYFFSNSRLSTTPFENYKEVKKAAIQFHNLLANRPPVLKYQSEKLIRLPYPTKFGFYGVKGLISPFLQISNRMAIVEFEVGSEKKVLLVSPTDTNIARRTPYFERLAESFKAARTFITNVISNEFFSVEQQLQLCGISPLDVDYITYDHLHTQDLTKWLGTSSTKGFFPNAKLLVTSTEWDSVKGLLPEQLQWYHPEGMQKIPSEKVIKFDHNLWVGDSIYLMRTPGHTMGNHSIAIKTANGVFVTSENGIGADSYSPKYSGIKAVRMHAERLNLEVILNGNTLESSVDQYISMVQEKYVAGKNSENKNFYNVATSSELESFWLYPGIKPTFCFGNQSILTRHK